MTPSALSEPAALVEIRLRSLLDECRRDWEPIDPLLGEMTDTVERLVLSGGKRVRPAMAHWGFIGAGGDPTDARLADLGAALELLQSFALFHDDVMDGSTTRRGAPTAHTRESARHRAEDWRGDARRYGEAVAILAGDIALVLSDVLLAGIDATTRALWNDLRVEVNLGQFLDVVGTGRGRVSRATADRIVEYKTARYTILRPLQMGAALAGRADLVPRLEPVGVPMGVAFQLRDDVLGALGESTVTGKPVGDDLREGKPTPLLAVAADRADPEQSSLLSRVGSDLDDDGIAAIQQVLIDTGAVADIEARIAVLTTDALEALDTCGLSEIATAQLAIIAHFLADRAH